MILAAGRLPASLKFTRVLKLVKSNGVCVCVFSCVQLFATPWTVARQAPLSMGFPRQEYWSGFPLPASGDLPDPKIEPKSLVSPALAGGFFPTSLPGKPIKKE